LLVSYLDLGGFRLWPALPGSSKQWGVVLNRVEVIGVTSGKRPSVERPEGSTTLFLTFDGLRDAKVRDRDTRIRLGQTFKHPAVAFARRQAHRRRAGRGLTASRL
jgi:hypothetical protein